VHQAHKGLTLLPFGLGNVAGGPSGVAVVAEFARFLELATRLGLNVMARPAKVNRMRGGPDRGVRRGIIARWETDYILVSYEEGLMVRQHGVTGPTIINVDLLLQRLAPLPIAEGGGGGGIRRRRPDNVGALQWDSCFGGGAFHRKLLPRSLLPRSGVGGAADAKLVQPLLQRGLPRRGEAASAVAGAARGGEGVGRVRARQRRPGPLNTVIKLNECALNLETK